MKEGENRVFRYKGGIEVVCNHTGEYVLEKDNYGMKCKCGYEVAYF